jgi:hypothetical protein
MSAAVMQVWAVAEIADIEINSTGIHFAMFHFAIFIE